ncbi:MAG: twin-arginine translocase TatA/TatE family subunit [Rhodospirillaceae bacterium]|jgi:sec-independent protein translocase protein TatA|nr:twin-arginine translocase TatA/TatE family subunit [Rhodospirillaceae bacterium]MBT5374436.1 twin-arginine translocase TatA/TatE family subunit [Rhodospirillaceae bacterium]MBT5660341.1 twin-arginine translocase TatA/TatE family subunit [Rhodospirillaceae bacterium]MBT5751933.1 twin-arginine translocase TatA/TatE family subunit [Rhodospirillaceae bacterium]
MSVGPWQIILILVIVLIIFGAGKLPRVMGDIAKGVKNFKSGLKDEESGDSASLETSESIDAPKKAKSEAAKSEAGEKKKAAKG